MVHYFRVSAHGWKLCSNVEGVEKSLLALKHLAHTRTHTHRLVQSACDSDSKHRVLSYVTQVRRVVCCVKTGMPRMFFYFPPCLSLTSSILLFLLQYGLLYSGGSRPGSPVFSGGALGNHSPQCLHAAAAPALLLEDCPAEPRLALQGGPFPVRECMCVSCVCVCVHISNMYFTYSMLTNILWMRLKSLRNKGSVEISQEA